MSRKSISFLMIVLLVIPVQAIADGHAEKWYQSQWCSENKGQMEVVMPDDSRCDCVTEKHAIEFDFAGKWSEAIGQSLNYAMQTGKRAGIVMIVEKQKDRRFWIRLNSIIQQFGLPIDTWIMTPKE